MLARDHDPIQDAYDGLNVLLLLCRILHCTLPWPGCLIGKHHHIRRMYASNYDALRLIKVNQSLPHPAMQEFGELMDAHLP